MGSTHINRTSKGERRRDAILAATLRLISERGVSAVTHRTVAERAGVPLAATTYYFASKEDLLHEALAQVASTDIERLERRVHAAGLETFTVPGLVEAFSVEQREIQTTDPESIVAQFELVLEAARQPKLRDVIRHWTRTYFRLAERVMRQAQSSDPKSDARLLVAIVDGLLIQQLAAPESNFDSRVMGPLLRRFATLIALESDGRSKPGVR